jgi:uracil-DNA glycosylase
VKRTIFIGQAMPKYKNELHDWPSLNKWLYQIGLTDREIRSYFYYSALVDYFPGVKNGSHRVPTANEILQERNRLKKTILDFKAEVVVPIGKLSINNCINTRNSRLTEIIGKRYECDPYQLLGCKMTVIPLPHPSGASLWHQNSFNKVLLQKALDILKEELRL